MGPILGWTAARGRIEWPAVALFAILFVWQFPHFMAIAWMYRDEYAKAGIRMLPVVQPDGWSTVVEALFYAKDATAAAKLGHARGVALLVLARAGLPIAEYEPTRVKEAVVGHGRADKSQVALMMSTVLRLPDPPRPDAADALAIAFAHAQAAPFDESLARMRLLGTLRR